MTNDIRADQRQLFWLVTATFVLLLLPATLAKLTGWRWRPWPPGPNGYGSILAETRRAAMTFAPLGFVGL